jgi:HK97 family phage major capsid protein
MKTVKAIKEDIAIVMRELASMRELCTAENRQPCEEERVAANEKLDKIDVLEQELALEERTQATLEKTKRSTTPPDKTPVDTKREKTAQEKRDSFASRGEFLQAVMRAGIPGQMVDPRLSTRAASGLSEGVPSDGGFLVDKEMSSELLKETWNTGMILPMISKMTLSGNKNGIKVNGLDETSRVNGSRAGGIVAYWKGEAAEKTGSKPKFRQIDLSLNKLIGLCYATDELMDDAQALAQTISEGFRDEFNFKITDAIIRGSGVGQPLGILNSGCVVSVSKETGQAADTILFENVQNMWSRILAPSRPNAIWVINQDCEPQMGRMSLAVGTGGVPVYMPAGGASASPYATLFGRPVVPIEQCETVGTTGDIMLCDFSKYKAIDKGGIQNDVSMHVRYVYDEQVFRFVYRFDGQPILGSAITPYKGTNTLSHFVKLDSRD